MTADSFHFYVDLDGFFFTTDKMFTKLNHELLAGYLIGFRNCWAYASTWFHVRHFPVLVHVAHLFTFFCIVFCFLVVVTFDFVLRLVCPMLSGVAGLSIIECPTVFSNVNYKKKKNRVLKKLVSMYNWVIWILWK